MRVGVPRCTQRAFPGQLRLLKLIVSPDAYRPDGDMPSGLCANSANSDGAECTV
jgi:hypothetical protein